MSPGHGLSLSIDAVETALAMASRAPYLNRPRFKPAREKPANVSEYQRHLHDKIKKSLESAARSSMNSGIMPTYMPGQEPKRWAPTSASSTDASSNYFGEWHSHRDAALTDDIKNSLTQSKRVHHIDLSTLGSRLSGVAAQDSDVMSLLSPATESITPSERPSEAKLRREARADHFRRYGKGPDLTKIYQFSVLGKNNKTYNRLAACDLTLYHPGRDSHRSVPSQQDRNINLRIALAKDCLKIIAILRITDSEQQPDASRFYNIASLSWPISSLPNSFVRCYVDKIMERKVTAKGRWQYKPTYFFEVRNQGKLEQGCLDTSSSQTLGINQSHLDCGFNLIRNIRDLASQSLNEQRQSGVETPGFWFSVHSLSLQTDDDDSLKQISNPNSKFEFISWEKVPQKLLEECLDRLLTGIQVKLDKEPQSIIAPETIEKYQEILQNAAQQGVIGIPIPPSVAAKFLNCPGSGLSSQPTQTRLEDSGGSSGSQGTNAIENMYSGVMDADLKHRSTSRKNDILDTVDESTPEIASNSQHASAELFAANISEPRGAVLAGECQPSCAMGFTSPFDLQNGHCLSISPGTKSYHVDEVGLQEKKTSTTLVVGHENNRMAEASTCDFIAEKATAAEPFGDGHFKMDMTTAHRVFTAHQEERKKAHRMKILLNEIPIFQRPSKNPQSSQNITQYSPSDQTADVGYENIALSHEEYFQQSQPLGSPIRTELQFGDVFSYFKADIDKAMRLAFDSSDSSEDYEFDTKSRASGITSSRFSNVSSLRQSLGLLQRGNKDTEEMRW
ncbi:hypothetical protein Dda_7214 [Drechslerella dactyloides]|uniref:Uncharacterized protein n=1 Tax=Drechslerella dactyloides TaxID=74499 RepID=A0AAD6ITM4_DREDA|nr:hypothetical protein Dda_7214 [Drechslerella dactyloides]